MIRHISGSANKVADWLSRLTLIETDMSPANNETEMETYLFIASSDVPDGKPNSLLTAHKAFLAVHNARMGHHGSVRTMNRLNKYFPGHGISYSLLVDWIHACPTCQKVRQGLRNNIEGIHRTLSQDTLHSAVGVDTLTVTPPDEDGNWLVIVIVNLFSKYVALFPASKHDASTLATALFQYFCTYGLCDLIVSDPGSDLMSDVVTSLHEWFGIRHRFSPMAWRVRTR
jgi:hypothetical protein